MDVAFDRKRNRVIISKCCLERFKHNPKDWKEIWFDIEVIDTINSYFEEKDKSYYIENMKNLSIIQEHELKEDYIEK